MQIEWQHIDHVFFDMDGTLLDLHYDNHFWQHHLPKRYAEIHNLPVQEAIKNLTHQIQSIEGQLNWYCLDYWAQTLNIDLVALKHETAHKIQWRPYAEAFLKNLKAREIPLYLVTNAHPKAIQIKNEHQPLTHYFDQVISSHDYQAEKESAQFWKTLSKHLPFNPDKTLFFDDNIQVLTSAKINGRLGHLYGIAKPDSRRPVLTTSPFPLVTCFSTLLKN